MNLGSVIPKQGSTGVSNTQVWRERTAGLGSQGWDEQLCRTRGHSPLRAKGKCSRSPNPASCSTASPWPATGARGFCREVPAGLGLTLLTLDTNSVNSVNSVNSGH